MQRCGKCVLDVGTMQIDFDAYDEMQGRHRMEECMHADSAGRHSHVFVLVILMFAFWDLLIVHGVSVSGIVVLYVRSAWPTSLAAAFEGASGICSAARNGAPIAADLVRHL